MRLLLDSHAFIWAVDDPAKLGPQAVLELRIHRDPFDRLLAAQCFIEKVPIVSSDAVFDSYAVVRVW